MNFLPILLLGGAAAFMMAQPKKKKSKIVNKGNYSYTRDCKKLYIKGIDADTENPTEEQLQLLHEFVQSDLVPAFDAARQAMFAEMGDGMDDTGVFIIELSARAANHLMGDCALKEGHRPHAGLAMFTVAMANVAGYLVQSGVDAAEATKEIAREMALVTKAQLESGGSVDIMKLIREEKANPTSLPSEPDAPAPVPSIPVEPDVPVELLPENPFDIVKFSKGDTAFYTLPLGRSIIVEATKLPNRDLRVGSNSVFDSSTVRVRKIGGAVVITLIGEAMASNIVVVHMVDTITGQSVGQMAFDVSPV